MWLGKFGEGVSVLVRFWGVGDICVCRDGWKGFLGEGNSIDKGLEGGYSGFIFG